MLRFLLVSSLLLSIVLGCKEQPSQIKESQESSAETQSPDLEEAIQLILDVPDFQDWFHPEVPDRLPLKLLIDEFIKKEYALQKFGQQVRIVDSATIKKEQIEDALWLRLRDTKKDTVQFYLYHQIEGAVMKGRLYKRNNQWNILIDILGEI